MIPHQAGAIWPSPLQQGRRSRVEEGVRVSREIRDIAAHSMVKEPVSRYISRPCPRGIYSTAPFRFPPIAQQCSSRFLPSFSLLPLSSPHRQPSRSVERLPATSMSLASLSLAAILPLSPPERPSLLSGIIVRFQPFLICSHRPSNPWSPEIYSHWKVVRRILPFRHDYHSA